MSSLAPQDNQFISSEEDDTTDIKRLIDDWSKLENYQLMEKDRIHQLVRYKLSKKHPTKLSLYLKYYPIKTPSYPIFP